MRARARGSATAVLAVALIAAACGGGSGGAETVDTTTTSSSTTTSAPSDAGSDRTEEVVAPLTGEVVPAGALPPRALVVKIGNNDDRARPQAGLVEADLVYEELIEGLKTRFAAVFHTEAPSRIGPVRSGRSGDIELMADLGRPYVAYSGGNPTVLGEFRAAAAGGLLVDVGILELEAPYTRDQSRDAPDNLYFDFGAVEEVPGEARPRALFDYESPLWSASDDLGDGIVVRYPTSFGRHSAHIWDPEQRGWVRLQDGTVHTAELGTGWAEVAPANVVVLETVYIDSPADAESPQPVTFGSGRAWILVEGRVFVGRWERSADQAGIRLTNEIGEAIGLTPGSTWVLLANDGSGSPRFGAADIEVLDAESAAEMLANGRELAPVNGEPSS